MKAVIVRSVSFRDKFVPVYKSGVFRKFMEINFCSLLKSWPSL